MHVKIRKSRRTDKRYVCVILMDACLNMKTKVIPVKKSLSVLSAAAVLSLIVSACGGGSAAPSSVPAAVSPSPSTAPSTASPSASAATPAPTPTPVESESVSPTPQAAYTYRMNSNYDIVPIAEDGERKIVLLTFDDGPKAEETLLPILDTLDKYQAKAIFFVNGYRVKQKPELLKLIKERGQIIGNHSYDHVDLKKETNESIDYQLSEVQKQIKELTGSAPVFFRPPHGSANEHVLAVAKQLGMLRMNWSNGSLDWQLDLPKSALTAQKAAAVKDNVFKMLHKGSNILMHELEWTAAGLDDLLAALQAEGYSFVDPNAIDPTVTVQP